MWAQEGDVPLLEQEYIIKEKRVSNVPMLFVEGTWSHVPIIRRPFPDINRHH